MTTELTFPLDQIITMGTGKLVTHNLMEGVYDIASRLSDNTMTTIALVPAFDVFGPMLLERFPWLKEVDESFPKLKGDGGDDDGETIVAWIRHHALKYGNEQTFDVEPFRDAWRRYDVAGAIGKMLEGKPVIVIEAP